MKVDFSYKPQNAEHKNMSMQFHYAVKKTRNKSIEHKEFVETDCRSRPQEPSWSPTMIGIPFG